MKRSTMGAAAGAAVAAAVATGGILASKRRSRWPMTPAARERRPRWHVITVNRPPDEVAPDGRIPEPLAELGDEVEVQVHRAVGDRGTALAARLRREPPGVTGVVARLTGDDPRQTLRVALRHSKQLLETGEVLRPDEPGTCRRTFTGLPLELATRRAPGEGRL
jgi:hypothetical protein